jgi:hypothetical protein
VLVLSQVSGQLPEIWPSHFQVQGIFRFFAAKHPTGEIFLDKGHEVDEIGRRAENRLALRTRAVILAAEQVGEARDRFQMVFYF